jgi:hypothetical protein
MLANQVYYFVVGRGRWGGTLDFRITDRQAYRKARIGLLNRLLVSELRLVIALLGPPEISSEITVDPAQGPAGTGWNLYALSKWGITLCVFKDVYRLDADGERVAVTTDLRYGPVPGILTDHVTYSARISDSGFRSQYEGLRLLGGRWEAAYEVAPDKNHVAGTLIGEWAEATEHMFRRNVGQR